MLQRYCCCECDSSCDSSSLSEDFGRFFESSLLNLNHCFLLSFSSFHVSFFIFHFCYCFLFFSPPNNLWAVCSSNIQGHVTWFVHSLKLDAWFSQPWFVLTFCFKVDTNIHPTIFPGSFSVRSIYWLDQHIHVLMLVQRQNREEMRSTGKWKKTSRTSSFIIPLNADHMMVSSAVLFISGFTCPSANCESELRFWGIFPFSPVLIHDLSALPLLIGVY